MFESGTPIVNIKFGALTLVSHAKCPEDNSPYLGLSTRDVWSRSVSGFDHGIEDNDDEDKCLHLRCASSVGCDGT